MLAQSQLSEEANIHDAVRELWKSKTHVDYELPAVLKWITAVHHRTLKHKAWQGAPQEWLTVQLIAELHENLVSQQPDEFCVQQ